jgi:hypothetical protein
MTNKQQQQEEHLSVDLNRRWYPHEDVLDQFEKNDCMDLYDVLLGMRPEVVNEQRIFAAAAASSTEIKQSIEPIQGTARRWIRLGNVY